MRIPSLLFTLPLLAHCAPAPPPGTAAGADSGAEADVGGARDCIDFSAVTSRGAEDERTIRFDLIGGAVYRNRLPGRCPGLRQASQGFGTLTFSVQGNSLCRGDLVRVVEHGRAGGGLRAAIPCPLGRFVPAMPRPQETPQP